MIVSVAVLTGGGSRRQIDKVLVADYCKSPNYEEKSNFHLFNDDYFWLYWKHFTTDREGKVGESV